MALTLDCLPIHVPAVISQLSSTDTQLYHKLLELGLTDGTEIEVVRHAPLGGDPICVRARGFELSLRLSEARVITVESL